jgi:catechol 2,3-dioxygenase-like lactoylglutathione lyase family enzyme
VITGLDHVVVLVRDIADGTMAYQTLLARTPAWRNTGDGADRVLFTLDNMTLELMAPNGDGATADRIREVTAEQGEGLASICFRTGDIAKMYRRLDRLALKPEPVAEVESRDANSGATLSWKRTRAATAATRGVRLFFLELAKERPLSPHSAAASITALDHVVVSTSDPERAAALYGARLGLDMALEFASRLGPADVLPLRRSHRRGRAPSGQGPGDGQDARQPLGIELACRRHRRDTGAAAVGRC